MKRNLFTLFIVIFFISCGETVKLDYQELENQYVELTPYWESVINNSINTPESAKFAVLYKQARELISEYKDPSRGVMAGGLADMDDRTNTEILWELRKTLQYASARTNSIALSLAQKVLDN